LTGVPVTGGEILDELRVIGVRPGMKLMVHSSLKSFGQVEGGALTVIRALMDAVGPEGTLLMPSFNHGDIFGESAGVAYEPLVTPTSNGIIPDTFWRQSGVRRSLNPTHPFACWGRDADRYTARHHETLTMGEDSPLGLLAHEGGFQVNLGTTHETTTAKHVAETMRRVPCLGYRTEEHPVRMPDGSVKRLRTWSWRSAECPLTESGALIEEEMERSRSQVKGRIGECLAVFFRIRDCLEAVWRLLDNGRGAAPPCARCPIRPLRSSRTVPSDWV